jgi:hypothetical protein
VRARAVLSHVAMIKILAALTALAACDETASSVQRDYVERHEQTFVFTVDRARLVEGVRQVVADYGLELVEPTTGDTLHTTRGLPQSDYTTEYTVHLISTHFGYLVHVIDQARDRDGKVFNSQRATELEWELAQRLEPERALAITEKANKRADRVAPRARTVAP